MTDIPPLDSAPEPHIQSPATDVVVPNEPEPKKKRRKWLRWLLLLLLAGLGYLAYILFWPKLLTALTSQDNLVSVDNPERYSGEFGLDLDCKPTAEFAVVPFRIDCRLGVVGEAPTDELKRRLASPTDSMFVEVYAEGVYSDIYGRDSTYEPLGSRMLQSKFGSSVHIGDIPYPPKTVMKSFWLQERRADFSFYYADGAENNQIEFRALLKIAGITELTAKQVIKLNPQLKNTISKGDFYYDVKTNRSSLPQGKVTDLTIDITSRTSDGEIYVDGYQSANVIFYPISSKRVMYDFACMGGVSIKYTNEYQHGISWPYGPSPITSPSTSCDPIIGTNQLQTGAGYMPKPYAWFPVSFKDGSAQLTIEFNGEQEFTEEQLAFVVVPSNYAKQYELMCPYKKIPRDEAYCADAMKEVLPKNDDKYSFLYGKWFTDDSVSFEVFTRKILPVK